MRGRLLTLFVLILALSMTNIAFANEAIPTSNDVSLQGGATATANNLINVRGGPGTGFWIVGVLNPLETVPIMGVSPDNAWWYINASFGPGWVSTAVVTANNTAGVLVQDPGTIIAVTAAELNVRGGPGEAAIALGRVYAGNQLILIGRSNDGSWLNVKSEFGNNTWVAARYTSVGDAAAPAGASANAPVTEAETFAVVNTAVLNVRSGAGVNYEAIGTVLGGERLPIIGRNADRTWYNVQTVFGNGWVSARYVAARNEFGNAPVTTATVDQTTFVGPTAIINTGALNIRSGDGAPYTILGVARGGDQFQIIGRNAEYSWVLIRTADFDGWVSRIYIIIRGDTSNLAIVNAGTTVTDPVTGETAAADADLVGPVAYVATGALNIRSGPNVSFESLGAVFAATRMSITGQSADGRWWQVDSPFGLGWVNKNYIIVEGNASTVPVVQ